MSGWINNNIIVINWLKLILCRLLCSLKRNNINLIIVCISKVIYWQEMKCAYMYYVKNTAL